MVLFEEALVYSYPVVQAVLSLEKIMAFICSFIHTFIYLILQMIEVLWLY